MRSCSRRGSRWRRRRERSRFRAAARRRRRRDHDGAVPGARSSRRDEAGSHARVGGRPGRRGGDPGAGRVVRAAARASSARSSATTAATRSGSSIRSTGRRTTCAACRCGRRCSRSSGTASWSSSLDLRTGARSALVGGARRGRVRERRAVPRVVGGARRRTRLSRRRRSAACRPVGATMLERAWANRGLSDFWQHCLVAEGGLDVACDRQMNLWDYAAVQLLVEEAGGRCTTFAGAAPTPARASSARTARCTARWSHFSASDSESDCCLTEPGPRGSASSTNALSRRRATFGSGAKRRRSSRSFDERIGRRMADRRAVARPRPVLRPRAELRPRRVECDVTIRLVEMALGLDHRVEVATCHSAPRRLVAAVVETGVARVEAMKTAAQRRFRRAATEQVEVVRHQRVCEDAPLASARLPVKKPQEQRAVTVVDEELRAVNGLAVDVVDRAGDFDARRSHESHVA